jgi:hypothetical protein
MNVCKNPSNYNRDGCKGGGVGMIADDIDGEVSLREKNCGKKIRMVLQIQ